MTENNIDKTEEKERIKKLIEVNQESTDSSDIDFELEEKYNALQREQHNRLLAIKEWNDVIEMRKSWSYWLLRTIMLIVVFDFFVIVMVGFKLMKFEGYIMPFFIGESLIKTLGLAIIVVKFLFNEKFISKGK